jgi:hypothetical protein
VGRVVRVDFDGVSVTAELLDERAPRICGAIWDALPLDGQVTNVSWSGDMLRLWVTIPEPPDAENVVTLQHPGDILFVPGWNGLRFVYGPAQMRGARGPHPVPRVGRLRGDLAEFVKLARRVEWEGAKRMTVTREDGR